MLAPALKTGRAKKVAHFDSAIILASKTPFPSAPNAPETRQKTPFLGNPVDAEAASQQVY